MGEKSFEVERLVNRLACWVALACALALPPSAVAAELKKKTLEAFERYARLTEARMDEELRRGPFLWVDGQPAPQRAKFYAQLRQSEIVIEHMETRDHGKEIEIPDGMVHHWVATIFVPGITLQQTLALVQDYDNHHVIYKPDVERSKLLARNGNDFKVYLRFYKKTLVTVVLNTENDIHFFPVDATRVHSRGYTTRIAQVENPGRPDEREKPVGNDSGLMWRLYSYWRFEQRDGGTYIQAESIGLTREIPFALRWLIKPLVTRIPREFLRSIMTATRNALTARRPIGATTSSPPAP